MWYGFWEGGGGGGEEKGRAEKGKIKEGVCLSGAPRFHVAKVVFIRRIM